MLLSLIIPFFNSEHNSQRLLKTLAQVKQRDVEFILINDGSTDNTFCLLEEFIATISESNVTLINQDNRGPGGARNSGLKVAKGKYVWFVDSDDDLRLEIISVIRKNCNSNYDFIDFNIQSGPEVINSMDINPGEYTDAENYRIVLLNHFGRISSKAIRREFLIENNILYPEYCLYEDNPLTYIYPFLVKSFLKTEVVGYIHHLEFESITRSQPSLRTLDRLYTSIYGFKKGLELAQNNVEVDILKEKFIKNYLTMTTINLQSIKPSKNWVVTWKVMKQYRSFEKVLEIKKNPFDSIDGSNKFKLYFTFHWAISFLITTDQTEYFDNIRKKAWN